MRYLLSVLLLVLVPAVTQAAYLNRAEVLRYEQDQNGTARLMMRFRGNAGEEIVDVPYPVTGGSTFPRLQDWVNTIVADLNTKRLAGKAPQVAPGSVVTGAALAAPPAAPKSVWYDKVHNYDVACTRNFTGSVATACTALKADIEGTYQSGFLDEN